MRRSVLVRSGSVGIDRGDFCFELTASNHLASTRVGALPLRWQLDVLAIDGHDDVRLVDNAAARLRSSAHFWFGRRLSHKYQRL